MANENVNPQTVLYDAIFHTLDQGVGMTAQTFLVLAPPVNVKIALAVALETLAKIIRDDPAISKHADGVMNKANENAKEIERMLIERTMSNAALMTHTAVKA